MDTPIKVYKYKVEYIKRGKWVPVLQTDIEEKDTFGLIANAEEYQYRILCDGEDVTEKYKNQAHNSSRLIINTMIAISF